jgi:hypothetical protein
MKLTPQQLSRLSELVNESMDLSDEARSLWLAQLDEPDSVVRGALLGVFSADGRAPDFTLAMPRASGVSGAQASREAWPA